MTLCMATAVSIRPSIGGRLHDLYQHRYAQAGHSTWIRLAKYEKEERWQVVGAGQRW